MNIKLLLKHAMLYSCAWLIGAIGWGGTSGHLVLLPLIIVLWAMAPNRFSAFCVMSFYYLASSHCLLIDVSTYWPTPAGTPDYGRAILYWTLPNVFLAFAWAMAWGKHFKGLRAIASIVLVAIPPFGLLGWASPMTAAGSFFPGLGWGGLVLYLVMLFFLVDLVDGKRSRNSKWILAVFFLGAVVLNLSYQPSKFPEAEGHVTFLGSSATPDKEFDVAYSLASTIQRESIRSNASVLLYPETVGGTYQYSEDLFEETARKLKTANQTAIVGYKVLHGTNEYSNAMVSIGRFSGVTWINRYPVPAGFWKPWDSRNMVRTAWFDSGVKELGNYRIGSLICYEQILIAPVFLTILANPDLIIAPSNVWFASGTNLSAIQTQATAAWSRLFNIPVVFATNRALGDEEAD